MNPIIETRDLTQIYSQGTPFEHCALDHVNFKVYPGEFIGVIGHTGSGKSTLMQHLNALIKPTSGQVLFDGKDIWSDKKFTREVRFQVGMVFQYPEYQLFEETVYKDIAFGPKNMKLSAEEIDRRVHEAAGFVDIPDDMLEMSPFELSGGQKRRVAIAGVIAMEPKVLILDEPSAGLDPRGRVQILQNIQAYQDATKAAIIMVSHSMDEMGDNADRLIVMDEPSMGLSPIFVNEIFDIIKMVSEGGTTVLLVEQNAKKSLSIADRAYVLETGHITMEGEGRELLRDPRVKKAYLGA